MSIPLTLAPPDSPNGKIKVLLVDGCKTIRDGLKLLLEAGGDITIVDSVSDGREITPTIEKHLPDIVILDIALPEPGGIEIAYQINKIDPLIQVIFLASSASTDDVYRALVAGARGFLLKRSSGSEIVSAVRAVYDGRRYVNAHLAEVMLNKYMMHHT